MVRDSKQAETRGFIQLDEVVLTCLVAYLLMLKGYEPLDMFTWLLTAMFAVILLAFATAVFGVSFMLFKLIFEVVKWQ